MHYFLKQYLPQCDRIVYIRDGLLFEVGTHTELMEANGEYAALYKTHMDTMNKEGNERLVSITLT